MKKMMKAVAAIMLMTAVVFTAGCNKPDDPNNEGNNNGGNASATPEYVDLGLPSGTLWATFNVGANSPEDYGNYFAWGETQPKTTYNFSTYKWCNGDNDQLTKYCNKSSYGYNGFTDDLTTLQPSDDAATANWGGGWYTPTNEQWQELFQNTPHTLTTRNGVNGMLFTASNGNDLFLPAAGVRWDNDLSYGGSSGLYWSSSLYTALPSDARDLVFESNGHSGMTGHHRYGGQSIRPVRSAN